MLKPNYKIIQYGVYPRSPHLIEGGIEAAVYGLTHSLTQQTHIHVRVVTYPQKYHSVLKWFKPTANIEVIRLTNRYRYGFLSVLSFGALIREIRNYRPDVCHLHGTTLLVLLTSLYLRISGKNYVITVHGVASVEYTKAFERSRRVVFLVKKWLYGFIEVLIINCTRKLIVDTEYVKTWVVQHRIWPCKQLIVAPQGINERYFSHTDYADSCDLISIGSISERKGFEYAIRAFKHVHEALPDVHFYIAGFVNDKAYFEKLVALIEDLSLSSHIHIRVNASQNDLIGYLRKAAVFVLHSHEESQGIVFCEAMATGKPIIATNVGGIPFVVMHGVNGLLSPFGDINTFAHNIVQMLTNKTLYNQVRQNNLTRAADYRWHSITNTILSLYQS